MGPLLLLIFLALRQKNTLTERMTTRQVPTAAKVINMRRPSLVWYHGAFSVGHISSEIKRNMHHTECQISQTTGLPPLGDTSKGTLLFVWRSECLSNLQEAFKNVENSFVFTIIQRPSI